IRPFTGSRSRARGSRLKVTQPAPRKSCPKRRSRITLVSYSELQAAGASGKTEMATILVVEVEFGIAEVLVSVLVEAGHYVVTAINGKQGLERLTERPPQLVLLDFMMPLLDGPGMLRAMKHDPAYRAIPTVIMSSL